MEGRHYTVGIYRQVSGTIIVIENAMTAMEDLRSQGKINYYGIATYAGLRVDHRHMSYIALDDIVNAAEKAGGMNHGLRYISLPMNIAMTEPLLDKHQSSKVSDGSSEVHFKSTLDKLNELKLNAMITQPFMAGYLLQTPLPTSIFRSRYIPVKHINMLRYEHDNLDRCRTTASSQWSSA